MRTDVFAALPIAKQILQATDTHTILDYLAISSHFSWQGSGIEIWIVLCFFIGSISKIILFKKHPLKYKKHIVHCLFNDAPLRSNQTNDTRFFFSI